jgi:hypothetical protein
LDIVVVADSPDTLVVLEHRDIKDMLVVPVHKVLKDSADSKAMLDLLVVLALVILDPLVRQARYPDTQVV